MDVPSEYCPVSIGAQLLADRWTVLIVRELLVGSHRFNQIRRGLPGLSRSLLTTRLRHLERIGVVERTATADNATAHEYHLTASGRELEELIFALGRWTVRWWFPEPQPHQVDNSTLLWRMRGALDTTPLEQSRTIIQFTFTDGGLRAGWLVIGEATASVCLRDPGFDVDLYVEGSGTTWHAVWFGHRSMQEALASGDITVKGPAGLVRAFPRLFGLSHFAPDVRTARSDKL